MELKKVRLMLVPQRTQAMNLRTGEVRWGQLWQPTVDIREIPDLYEVIARRFRNPGGVVAPLHEGGREG